MNPGYSTPRNHTFPRDGVTVIPYDLDPAVEGHDDSPRLTFRTHSGAASLGTSDDDDHLSVTSFPFPPSHNGEAEYGGQSCPSSNLHFHPVRLKKKSVFVTYFLTLFLGIVGAHHFYLGRPKFGTLYIFTAGLLGLGYVVDLIRVPWLVENANLELHHPELRGRKYLMDAYLLWLPPFGLLGFHHIYLGNVYTAIVYMISLGAIVLGWLLDICFVPLIWMKIANVDYQHVISTVNNHNAPDNTEVIRQPDVLSSHDCVVVMSSDDMAMGEDAGRPRATLTLSPPPYSEVDELAGDACSPPSYEEVLAMSARESIT
ncbi:uncharacterized protein LOC124264284 [Haliotis rubra]|uniref:uncharacterized protein LOC124264284 n=1 Tax=Haliotis rubra TaxID=36100 RepID=UPI001EE61FAE|nr:uncharacterized protein LOC124264284 [Haliotis rubra]XP_046554981.1 uncharacterized protein LOC124264284 [Haliotis rubra]